MIEKYLSEILSPDDYAILDIDFPDAANIMEIADKNYDPYFEFGVGRKLQTLNEYYFDTSDLSLKKKNIKVQFNQFYEGADVGLLSVITPKTVIKEIVIDFDVSDFRSLPEPVIKNIEKVTGTKISDLNLLGSYSFMPRFYDFSDGLLSVSKGDKEKCFLEYIGKDADNKLKNLLSDAKIKEKSRKGKYEYFFEERKDID